MNKAEHAAYMRQWRSEHPAATRQARYRQVAKFKAMPMQGYKLQTNTGFIFYLKAKTSGDARHRGRELLRPGEVFIAATPVDC